MSSIVYVQHGCGAVVKDVPPALPTSVDDLGSRGLRPIVDGIDVVHLDRRVRVHVSLDVELHHAELDPGFSVPEKMIQSSPSPPSRPITSL